MPWSPSLPLLWHCTHKHMFDVIVNDLWKACTKGINEANLDCHLSPHWYGTVHTDFETNTRCESQNANGHGSGGAGFFLPCDDFGGRFHKSLFAFTFLFLFCFSFCFHGDQLTSINSTSQQGSVLTGSACRDDCKRAFPDALCVSSIPWQVPTLAWTAESAHSWLYWVKGVCQFRCNLPPALLAEWPGSFTLPVW